MSSKAAYFAMHRVEFAAKKKAYYEKNREKSLAQFKAYYAAHKAGTAKVARKSRLKSAYGIGIEDYTTMLANQEGLCKICKGPAVGDDGRSAHIDHCHTTGKIRGILCHLCNKGLGQFKDSEEALLAAVEYLRKSREN